MAGPLTGIRVLEIPNIGPLQHAGMLLSDLGAEVLRLDRKTHVDANSGLQGSYTARSILDRGRLSAGIDLKHPAAADLVLRLAEHADVMIEGFRPGVAERLGIGPDAALARNPGLIYGRMTGWGQDGPMAREVGHDINYISLAGVLAQVGPAGGVPTPPLNLVGDFGGGSLFLVVGVLAALVERATSGIGQVIDAAMIDGATTLMAPFFASARSGGMAPRGTGILDGGAHFYGAYECADGEYVSVAAIEPQFYAEFSRLLGLDLDPALQYSRDEWALQKPRIAALFKTKTRVEWLAVMDGHEVCFAPVLTISEAVDHPHHTARGTFTTIDGVTQPAPAPRFSRSTTSVAHPARPAGNETDTAYTAWGISSEEVAALKVAGAIS